MPDSLTPGDFRDLSQPLALEVEGAPAIELSVESVSELPPHRFRAAPFALLLKGPPEPLLAQATYALRHPRLGRIEVFLVPLGRDATGASYEAIFN